LNVGFIDLHAPRNPSAAASKTIAPNAIIVPKLYIFFVDVSRTARRLA
jgi:hypothetical protein